MIDWCNQNAGFLTALGVVATLLGAIATSVVAVLVARGPHKAALNCNWYLDEGPKDAQGFLPYTLHVRLYNSGKVQLRIDEITVINENHMECGSYRREWPQVITPMEGQAIDVEFSVPETCLTDEMLVQVKTQRKTFTFGGMWAVG